MCLQIIRSTRSVNHLNLPHFHPFLINSILISQLSGVSQAATWQRGGVPSWCSVSESSFGPYARWPPPLQRARAPFPHCWLRGQLWELARASPSLLSPTCSLGESLTQHLLLSPTARCFSGICPSAHHRWPRLDSLNDDRCQNMHC